MTMTPASCRSEVEPRERYHCARAGAPRIRSRAEWRGYVRTRPVLRSRWIVARAHASRSAERRISALRQHFRRSSS